MISGTEKNNSQRDLLVLWNRAVAAWRPIEAAFVGRYIPLDIEILSNASADAAWERASKLSSPM